MSDQATAAPVPPAVQAAEVGANVYAKIANIQHSIHTVIKGGYNEHFKYSFARERDVVAEVKPLLGREGLVITHTLKSEQETTRTRSSGTTAYLTKLTFTFRITNVKDPLDFVEADAIGFGQDGEDKGAPKAYTMALKYFLAKMFLVETGDDAEETGRSAGKKGAKGTTAPAEEKFETAKRMIKESRNTDGLLEYATKLKDGKTFNATQKKELNELIKTRIEELGA